ncbi:MAG TPA: hypothetical protein VJS92_17090 [Candidatus Polarisedimenticolaceae bacterium]|nr:hypothetical protein [Candidatus Polarisedimenticolaceae bacterium]
MPVAALFVAWSVAAAGKPPQPAPRPSVGELRRTEGPVTVGELQALLMQFADRTCDAVGEAVREIRDANPAAPRLRRDAQLLRVQVATVTLSIAADPNPQIGLLDMVSWISLQAWALEGERGASRFGTAGRQQLAATFFGLTNRAWEIAGRALEPDEQAELREMIDTWKRNNPQAVEVGFVRFRDFAAARAESPLARVRATGVLRRLVPIGETNRQIEETRLLGERAMFLAQRMPALVRWQAEALLDEAVLSPRVEQALGSVDAFSAQLERLPERIDAQLRALLDELGRDRDAWTPLVTQARGTLVEGTRAATALREASDSLEHTLGTAERVLGRVPQNSDVASYVAALDKLAAASRDLQAALTSAERLMASGALDGKLAAQGRGWVDHAFSRAALLLLLAFLLLVVYRVFSWWLARRA